MRELVWGTLSKAVLGVAIVCAGAQVVCAQEDVVSRLRQEVAAEPQRLDLALELGNAAASAGQLDLALENFRKVLEHLEPDSRGAGDVHLRIGETYRRKGDLASAIASLTRASELLADQPVVMGTLALVLDGAGKKAEAERAYRVTLKLDPENGVTLNNLAFLLTENGGDLEEALELAKRANGMLPEDSEVTDTLGWIYLKLNHAEQAIATFEGIVRKEPRNPTYHFHLGMALTQKGDKPASVAQLQEALNCDPSQEEAGKIGNLLDRLRGSSADNSRGQMEPGRIDNLLKKLEK